jgi:hypothetical protein
LISSVKCYFSQETSSASQSVGVLPPKEQKLPLALEKVLAFKDARVSQVGMKPEDLERVEKGKLLCTSYLQ